jgi:hypothetical protein
VDQKKTPRPLAKGRGAVDGASRNERTTDYIAPTNGVKPSRDREDFAQRLRALLAPIADELALLIERRAGDDEAPLARWPGSARQWRRVASKLGALGIEAPPAIPVGRALYLRRADLEGLPALLARSRAQPDSAPLAVDRDPEAERIAEELVAGVGKRLASAPRRTR